MSRLFGRRLLIEAAEGCGITHWARIDSWDGEGTLAVTDLGGERFQLTIDSLSPVLLDHLTDGTICDPLDIDAYLPDEIIQSALFGAVIYRTLIRRRPEFTA
ncbi:MULTISPECIES: hypothetical protein [unclassified Gordonia (in: high G+C Gram-positive bacteria)]|jgi:hypothetical protein|uniref:hypothetical protein n=1 Tax=Gordonia sp. VNQ95 TaxID=3156619 RepID=UPI0032B3E0C8